jgi:hypothetical protein
MTEGAPDVDRPQDVSIVVPEIRRARVVVRRRAHGGHTRRRWTARASRRRTLRAAFVCAGVLVLMAVGLYFGLSRQEAAAPAEGAFRPMIAMSGRTV